MRDRVDATSSAAGEPELDGAEWQLPVSSRSQQVTDRLRSAIISGRIAPGQRLKQDWLSGQFNVSQAPVREAIRQLESEGLVRHVPNRGPTSPS